MDEVLRTRIVLDLEARCPRCGRWHTVETRKNRKEYGTASAHGSIDIFGDLRTRMCHGGERWKVTARTRTRWAARRYRVHESGRERPWGGEWIGPVRETRGMEHKPTAEDRAEARVNSGALDERRRLKALERAEKIRSRLEKLPPD